MDSITATGKDCIFSDNFLSRDLVLGFSNRQDGDMSLACGNTENVLNRRRAFLAKLGVDYRDIVCAKQAHSSRITCVQDSDRGKGALIYDTAIEGTDAMITDRRNIPLSVFTADCLSVFLYSSKHKAIGLVHAGWRGTKDNISAKAVFLMQERFNVPPPDLCVVFGPLIRQCCYRVGKECAQAFSEEFVVMRDEHYYLDLAAANKAQLLSLGIEEARIFNPEICTSCRRSDFFSFRREKGSAERMMSLIMLK